MSSMIFEISWFDWEVRLFLHVIFFLPIHCSYFIILTSSLMFLIMMAFKLSYFFFL